MRFSIKDAGNITFYNKATGVPAFYTEDANTFEFKLSAESVYAKAKGNKAIAFEGEVNCDLKIEFEVVQFAQLSVMMASDVVDKTKHSGAKSFKTKVKDGNKVILPKTKPVSGTIAGFKLQPDGQEFDEKLVFEVSESGQDTQLTISTPSTIRENDSVIIFYQEEKAKVKTITMSTNGDSPNFRIEADVCARDTDGKLVALHLSIKNAKAKRNAELSFSAENPSKLAMELDCFPDEDGNYAELLFFTDDDSGVSPLSLAESIALDEE